LREAERIKSEVPWRYPSANFSILWRCASRASSSNSSSEPSTPSETISSAEGEHTSSETGEVGRRNGIGMVGEEEGRWTEVAQRQTDTAAFGASGSWGFEKADGG